MRKWEKLDNYISVSKLIRQNKQDHIDELFFDYVLNHHRLVFTKIKEVIFKSNEDPALSLKRDFFAKYPFYRNIYYKLLYEEGYRVKDDLLDCVSDLCTNDMENKIKKWEQLDSISNIVVDKKTQMITITSSSNEKYSFFPITTFYREEVNYIRQKHTRDYPELDESNLSINGYNPYASDNLEYCCHYVATEFVKLHPECYAVASICPHCFVDCYWYHSFVIDKKENYVIDIANGFVMPLGDFISLLEPTILCKVKGENFAMELENILPEFQEECLKENIMSIAFTHVENSKNFSFLLDK